jgi:ABC-2 type transport system permease protein
MRRSLAIARRILSQILRDPRTLALVIVGPIFVVFLLHAVVTAGELVPRIAVVGGEGLAKSLETRAEVVRLQDADPAAELLERGEVDAVVELAQGGRPKITVDAADPSASGAAMKALREALAENARSSLPAFAAKAAASATPDISFVHGSATTTTFDFLAPVVLGFLVFFFTFILAGIAFLRERTSGTMERAFAAPVRRLELIAGYMIGFGVVAAAQTAVLQYFIVGFFAAPNASGFLPAIAVNLAVAFAALSMGLFLSAFANSEFQMLQFIPLVIVPQVLFAGIFNLRSGPPWMTAVAWFFPLTYAGRALRDLMIRGAGLVAALDEIAALLAFGAVFLALAVAGLRRYRVESVVSRRLPKS